MTQTHGIICFDNRILHLNTALKIKIYVTCNQGVRKKEVRREEKRQKEKQGVGEGSLQASQHFPVDIFLPFSTCWAGLPRIILLAFDNEKVIKNFSCLSGVICA